MRDNAAIECQGVSKIFGKRAEEALQAVRQSGLGKTEVMERYHCVIGVSDASFSVRRGEVFCIMGLSGSGKSTLVRHINRLIEPTSGEILIDGEAIGRKTPAELRRLRGSKIGMVFQNFGLLPHRSVLDNVAYGLELRHVPRDERLAIAEEKLALVQLAGWGDLYPDELSGGMQQRVGLARALACDPEILLLDEPFGALDPLTRRQLQDLFFGLSRSIRKTTVFITHDLDEAIRLGDRIAIMRDGRLVQIGTAAEIAARPADAYVAEFVQGVARLKLLTAAEVMRPLPVAGAMLATADCPRAALTADFERLIALAVEHERPIVIEDDRGEPLGMVDRATLLRSVQADTRRDRMVRPEELPAADLEGVPRKPPPEMAAARPAAWRAALGGPLWAVDRALWLLAIVLGSAEALGLYLVIGAFVGAPSPGGNAAGIAGALLLFGVRLLPVVLAGKRVDERAERLRSHRGLALFAAAAALLALYGFTVYAALTENLPAAIAKFPTPGGIAPAVANAIDAAVEWSIVQFEAFFDQVTALLRWLLNTIESAFVDTPWPLISIFVLLVSWATGGLGVVLFAAASLAYLGLFGFWEKSMETLALVACSVFMCVLVGMPLGVLCAKSRRATKVIEPVLDVMQTLPTFVYLLPAVAFFSIGKPPGVIATVIFAMPPMIRLTALGIRQVPAAVKEASLAFGASQSQTLRKVELPLAVPAIMTGINQTVMMSLSMVVIAALIGAGGLGSDILRALNFLQTGQGFLAGMAIVLVAMLLDRMVRGRPGRRRRRRH